MPGEAELCLAIDIGGTKTALALIDRQGQVRDGIHTFPVPFQADGSASAQGLIDAIAPFVNRARLLDGNLGGIGLSLCGNVHLLTGEAVLIPNLHWRRVPFGRMLSQAFGLPVAAATDVRQATLAEHTWGAAQGIRYFAWCTVGTGYGGYFFLDGKLYDGYHGYAGPFGHTTVDEINGYPCGCGRRGCLETFVAGPAIARQGQAAVDQGRSPLLSELAAGQPVTTALVFQARQAGDPEARRILEQVVRLIAINLGGLVNTLDLQRIVLGGGVVNANPDFVPWVDRKIRDYLMSEESRRDLRVVKESLPNSALFGAAVDAFTRL